MVDNIFLLFNDYFGAYTIFSYSNFIKITYS